jgi:perosamine synthetase
VTEVPFSRPYFAGTEAAALAEVIESRWVTQGPRVEAFEREWARRCDAAHAVAVSNCTTGMHLALMLAGVGPGDEVVVPSLSFIATANAVRHCGATPVFADVDPVTYNVDPAAAEAAVTERTVAVMPVHQVGLPADLDAFADLGRRRGLAIVEDAACAIGARHGGTPIGSHGNVACFSLHARKIITTGDGGMITTDDGDLAARMRRLRHQGMSVSDLARHRSRTMIFERFEETGYNYRMTDLQAAVGLCQLEVLDDILAARRRLAGRYTEALAGLPAVVAPAEPEGVTHTWQSYMPRLHPEAGVDRDGLLQAMLDDGVATRRGVMATHLEPAYADGPRGDLPVTEELARDGFLLPLFPELADAEQDRVVERLAAHLPS